MRGVGAFVFIRYLYRRLVKGGSAFVWADMSQEATTLILKEARSMSEYFPTFTHQWEYLVEINFWQICSMVFTEVVIKHPF